MYEIKFKSFCSQRWITNLSKLGFVHLYLKKKNSLFFIFLKNDEIFKFDMFRDEQGGIRTNTVVCLGKIAR